MIAFRHAFLGVCAAAAVMIPYYVAFWLYSIGGLRGMYDDDSYPMSLVGVPIVAAIFSAIAFWIWVFPSALLARRIAHAHALDFLRASLLAGCLSALGGVVFGLAFGDWVACVAYGLYMFLSSLAFWFAGARVVESTKTVESTGTSTAR